MKEKRGGEKKKLLSSSSTRVFEDIVSKVPLTYKEILVLSNLMELPHMHVLKCTI